MQFNSFFNRLPCRRRYIKKTILLMKLTTIFILAAFMQVSARSWSQTVTFSGKNVSLEKIFSIIKKQTGYVVFYDYNLVDGSQPVTISVKNQPLNEFLSQALKG